MKETRSLLEVLFPKVRAELIRILFSNPSKRRHVRELRNKSELALSTVQDELRKLAAVGLINTWKDRNRRFCCANHNHPVFSEIVRLVQTSERLPRTNHSALHRSSQGKQRKPKKLSRLTSSTAPNWGIFSPRGG